jgi:IclR family acetate operon transcriptional repressor
MHQKPAYILSSIDNALELIQLLRDTGQLRLSDAAKSLEISNSTAHRLMAMLVYRGFAIQGDDRVYLPGPSMAIASTTISLPLMRSIPCLPLCVVTDAHGAIVKTCG